MNWRIESLDVQNFRRIKRARLSGLADVVAICGRNDEGKTSLLDAARYLFLGHVKDATGKRALIADLIGPHAKAASLEALIVAGESRYIVRATVGKPSAFAVYQEGNPAAIASSPDQLCALLGMNPAHAELALNPGAMLSGSDVGDVLAAMTGAGAWDEESVREYAGENWSALEAYLDGKPPVSIEALGRDVYADRAVVKQEIARLKASLAQLAKDAPETAQGVRLTPEHLLAIEQRIAELEAERDRLNREIGAACAPRETLADADRLDAEAKALRKEADKVERRAVPCVKPFQESVAKLAARIDDGAGKIAAQEERARGINENVQALRVEVRRLDLASAEPEAELFPHGVCNCGIKLTAGQLKSARLNAEAVLSDARQKYSDAMAKLASEEDAFGRANDGLVRMRNALKDLRAELEKDKQSIADVEAMSVKDAAEAKALRNQAVEKEQRAAAIRSQPDAPAVDKAGLEAALAETLAELERGRGYVATVKQVAERHEAEAEINDQEIRRAFLEWACAAFERGQYAQSVAEQRAETFAARANETLKTLGYALKVKLTGNALEFLVGRIGAGFFPYRSSSKAVRTMTQIAVAAAYSNGLIVVDDVEGMDGFNRLALVSMLQTDGPEIMDGRALWFAAAYSIPDDPDVDAMREAMRPLALVWVENGTTK